MGAAVTIVRASDGAELEELATRKRSRSRSLATSSWTQLSDNFSLQASTNNCHFCAMANRAKRA